MRHLIGLHYLEHPGHRLFVAVLILAGVLGITYSVKAYPQVFNTEVNMAKNRNISCTEGIVLDFNFPVRPDNFENIKVTPEEDIILDWQNSNKRLLIRPKNFWKPETRYSLHLPQGKNIMFVSVPTNIFSFSTVEFPQVKAISPPNGTKDITLDIEEPLVVDFTKSTQDFFVKFAMNPSGNITYQNNSEKTQFKLLPMEKIKEGTEYEIKVYIKYAKDSDANYKEIYTSKFETIPPAPTNWEKDFNLRLAQSQRFTKAKIKEGKYIDIDLAHQILSIFENGKMLGNYLISSGKNGMNTPAGEFKVMAKRARPWSKKYALYMPWFMQFTTAGHGIHELPEWPGGYKEGANHLGIPVSHGCVRLGIGPAKTVYEWAEVGTPIVIY